MFKKYSVSVKGQKSTVDFYVHSRKTKNGFCHEAVAIGPLPFPVCLGDRYAKAGYANRTWEAWPGHDCLGRLWEKLSKCGDLGTENPFGETEPKHEELVDPEELFGRFRG